MQETVLFILCECEYRGYFGLFTAALATATEAIFRVGPDPGSEARDSHRSSDHQAEPHEAKLQTTVQCRAR